MTKCRHNAELVTDKKVTPCSYVNNHSIMSKDFLKINRAYSIINVVLFRFNHFLHFDCVWQLIFNFDT